MRKKSGRPPQPAYTTPVFPMNTHTPTAHTFQGIPSGDTSEEMNSLKPIFHEDIAILISLTRGK